MINFDDRTQLIYMHELSIVMGIIDVAKKELAKAKLDRIETIELDIGTLSGIEFEALDFAWEMAVSDTVLENAERKINRIQAKAKCVSCGYTFNTNSIFDQCPKCNEMFTEILSGKELKIKSITAI
jgi:hydrogenase nickel incorporation protein HypA/HybF